MGQRLSTIMLGLALAWPLAGHAGITPGARLAGACAACHGPQGRSAGGIPTIAGMDAQAFIARMQAFRTGGGTLMNRVASAYSDTQIEQMARYFAAQRADEQHDQAAEH